MSKRFSEKISDGIICIDTGLYRPKLAACYLIVQKGYAAIIDTGVAETVPRILECLKYAGVPCENVQAVIPTHVHLDHAGAAGQLMQHFPNAQLYVHPRGARHMIDPAKLQASAKAVYGEEQFNNTFGELLPVPAERVHSVDNKESLNFNGRPLTFLHTPGHANHHICIVDKKSKGIFTGDTFGLSYKEFDSSSGAFIMPTTTPVQFEPDAWQDTLDVLLSYKPECMYLTHYGKVENVTQLADTLRQSIADYVTIAKEYRRSASHRDTLKEAIFMQALNRLAKTACALSEQECRTLLEMDIELNAQGLEVWLNKVYA